jgi:S1-C subfamily serine protease
MELEEIPLAPEAAAVGLEIRLVGNGSEEMLSVFAGTIARLDRHASLYTTDGYNDFNTFYMQAALGTKRGSSGSPVIDCDGQAVGLNAAGTNGSAAFFLPLDRVARALKILQRCKDESNIGWQAAHIPRGTLQMTLSHNGFHEALRLGLPREVEELVRKDLPAETGFLVIRSMVLGGPAQNHLRIWDVLVRVNGDFVTRFLKLETVLDDNVGKTIDIEVVRGGVLEKVSLKVQDLHSITPNNFLELSGGVIHPLSYQQARNFLLRCGTLYVAKPGYMLSTAGVPPHAIIKSLAGKETRGLLDFIIILSRLRRGVRVPLEYMTRENRHQICCALVNVDRHEWYAETM